MVSSSLSLSLCLNHAMNENKELNPPKQCVEPFHLRKAAVIGAFAHTRDSRISIGIGVGIIFFFFPSS